MSARRNALWRRKFLALFPKDSREHLGVVIDAVGVEKDVHAVLMIFAEAGKEFLVRSK